MQEDRLSPKQVALVAKFKRQHALTASCVLAANKGLYQALVDGALYDKKLRKWMRHKDLLNHPDPEIRKPNLGDSVKDKMTPRGRIS